MLETLVQNLQFCTYTHGFDTVFDVQLCLAHVVNILNITCTDQVNVRADIMLLVNFLYQIFKSEVLRGKASGFVSCRVNSCNFFSSSSGIVVVRRSLNTGCRNSVAQRYCWLTSAAEQHRHFCRCSNTGASVQLVGMIGNQF